MIAGLLRPAWGKRLSGNSFLLITPLAGPGISNRNALRTVAVELSLPLHHVCLAAVFFDESADAVATFAGSLGAFEAQRVELALDVAEDDTVSGLISLSTVCDRQVST